MKKKLGIVEKYKPLWEGGKSVEQYNIKVGFKIRMFCVQELNKARQQNPNLFGQKETDELTKMIVDLKQDKGTIKPEDQNCPLEDYQMFLQEFFQKVDYEDRHGTVTIKTTSKFRLMASFIDVLASWGPIDDEMIRCKKYCQFKAIDIFKALKEGRVPKRGGPKEQENNQDAGLGNEIDELAKDIGDANIGNQNNFNQNQGGNFNQQMPNNQFGGNNPYVGQQHFNQQGNNTQFGNPFGNQNQNNMNQGNNTGFSNPFGNPNNNINNAYNQKIPQQHPPQQHQQKQPTQQYQQQYQGQPQHQQNRYNPPQQNQNQQGYGGMNKARKSKVFPSKNDQQKRIFKGKYELNAKIPIKYNSVDYFMLVENVRINNETALREFKRGKASDILNMVLDSLEFLSYIHK
jgi:hypothetical protein